MTSPLPVVVNRSGGTAASLGDRLEATVTEAFAAAGLGIDLHLVEGRDLLDCVAACAGHRRVAVGGGDGSLGGAAAVLAKNHATLGILPLGTRNHLAKDLGIPDDLAEAAKVVAEGCTARIDIAHANDRAFVNNCVIGTYTRLVRMRDRSTLPKLLATIPAAWSVFLRHDERHLRLAWKDGAKDLTTPMLFIGNNRYSLEEGRVGTRAAIDEGRLSIFAVAPRGRWALIGFALRALIGRADPMRDFDALLETAKIDIDAPGATFNLALDGEIVEMDLPVGVHISPRAVSVFVPKGQAAGD